MCIQIVLLKSLVIMSVGLIMHCIHNSVLAHGSAAEVLKLFKQEHPSIVKQIPQTFLSTDLLP